MGAITGMSAEAMRVQRAIAQAGLTSRRGAEALVAAGRVTVNGTPAVTGQSVVPSQDDIRVDGQRIAAPAPARWFVLNKPPGAMTTRRDPQGRRTVFELVPDVAGLTYVGRLDLMTEGVLLLTNDGAGAHTLSHPSGEVPRTYVAWVRGDAQSAATMARRGVVLDDGMVRVDRVVVRPGERKIWEFEVTMHEGKNREVRRLCEALELRVERLVRIAYGSVTLGSLKPGEWRELQPQEIRRLLKS
jgi:23S rRNA pseudouridine2605 synthase